MSMAKTKILPYSGHLALVAYIKLGWKGLPGTNILADYENSLIMEEKVL